MKEVKIGDQVWAQEDLKVTRFRNGEKIPRVSDNEKWSRLDSAAYCLTEMGNYLYNWYAVNDPRGLAPKGWYVPTDEEWTELTEYLGGERVAGYKMKSPIWDGSNTSGFDALPGGYRCDHGVLGTFRHVGYWWSSLPDNSNAYNLRLSSYYDDVYLGSHHQRYGFSVRCIKRN